MSSDDGEYVRRMADALRSGARMLADHCPVCNNPLFEIGGQIWCLKCNKRVIKVKGEEDVEDALTSVTLTEVVKTLTAKVEELNLVLKRAADPEEIGKLAETVKTVLETLEAASRLRRQFTKEGES
ncbi:MAG: hypothetical protein DRN64_01235 [Thaumarchaeota archaeon]|nr:MAG: hypothetical protein DRN64_01235 [Nitrososphaerota archaeon]